MDPTLSGIPPPSYLSLSTLPWQTRNPQTLITEQPISGCGSLTGYSEYTGLIGVLSLIQIDVC